MQQQELANWRCRYRLSKYHEDIKPYQGQEHVFHQLFKPYEVIEGEGNCLLNSGIDEMWDLITGVVSGATHIYNNAAAQIGVGDSDTAADATQTDLQAATNKTYKAMESGYPTSTSHSKPKLNSGMIIRIGLSVKACMKRLHQNSNSLRLREGLMLGLRKSISLGLSWDANQ